MGFHVNAEQFGIWLTEERKTYDIYAPMRYTGGNTFSNVDCIRYGECVINCPNRAWTRSQQKYYRLTLLGRTGKKNPRLGEDFIKWADEDSIIKIILNTHDYVKEYIDPNAPSGKEHIGYILDRTGFEEFKRWTLKGVTLPENVWAMKCMNT